MSAITQIPEHFATQFDTNWRQLVQQKNSRLKDRVTLDSISGKEKSYNQIDEASMQLITARAGETRITDQATAKRWIRPVAYDTAKVFDEFDEQLLGEIVLPTSPVVQSHGAAYMRTCDQVIINALGGTAYTGESGTTAANLASANQVAVDFVESGSTANSGLTIAKLRQAKYILDAFEVDDDEERIFVLSAKQLQDLLGTTQVGSVDYNSVKALVDGALKSFMGFTFRRSQLLDRVVATDVRSCYAYVKSGITLAERGLKTHMDVRVDLSHSLQIRSVASLAAVRMEEKKVVQVFCDESP